MFSNRFFASCLMPLVLLSSASAVFAEMGADLQVVQRSVVVEQEKVEQKEQSNHTGAKIVGGLVGATLAVATAPLAIIIAPLAILPPSVITSLGTQESGRFSNTRTIVLPALDQVAKVDFRPLKLNLPREWGLNPDLNGCPFSGVAVPYTKPNDLNGEIQGRAILLTKRICRDVEESVLLFGVRTEGMIFFNKGTMQAGYGMDFVPMAKDNAPEWLGQVFDRLAIAAEKDQSIRAIYEDIGSRQHN